ncbi:MAG TPA: translation elongation factor Ts [Mycobacteriales bacterium]|nr:translation elongation factor Ts [Mycobacteriales bacterium]
MAEITTADIKKLRELTGAGMSDTKQALVAADGDFDKAIESLRLKGLKGVVKRGERTASNGLVTAWLDGTRAGTLLELNCETDFVAKSERFQALAADVLRTVVERRPADVAELLGGPLAGAEDITVEAHLSEAGIALSEKLEVNRFVTFEGAYVAAYLHRTSPDLPPTIGVLVELGGENAELASDLAKHVSWAAPQFLARDEVPAGTVETERRIAEQLAREEGKPEAALSKIVEGRVSGFYKEVVLLEQAFVKDNKRTVGQILEEGGLSLVRFARFKVGEA